MAYPGGKDRAGVYQKLINLMPPHETYIEPFLGGGAVMAAKRPAKRNIGLDLDEKVIAAWSGHPTVEAYLCCGINYLLWYDYTGGELVYCDPPHLMSTHPGRRVDKYELSESEHAVFLDVLRDLPCRIIRKPIYRLRWICRKLE